MLTATPTLPDKFATVERFLRWSDECRSLAFTGIIRVSTSEQADYLSRSLEAQADEIAEFRSKFDLDFDGTPTGFNSKNHPYRFQFTHTATESGLCWGPDVTVAIEHASETGRVLVCCGLDRFSKQPLSEVTAKLTKHGIHLLVLDLGNPVDPADILTGRHFSTGREKGKPNRNSLRGIRYKRKHGLGTPCGRPPKAGTSKEARETVEYAYLLHCEGKSLSEIAYLLNLRQRPPGGWNKMAVKRMLDRHAKS